MWLINIKTFIKHLLNNRLYSVITVLGFAMSLTFVILLSVYLKSELSVNSTQINKDRIYRLTNEKFSNTAPPIGGWLQSEFPQIESFTRVYKHGGFVLTPNDERLLFDYLLVDSTFLNIFTIPLIEGDAETALKTKNSAVLSKEYSHKIFGDESPIGKQLKIGDKISVVVTGVYKNLSELTHFTKVDALVNFRLLADIWGSPTLLTSKGNCSFDLYLLEKKNANLASKTPEILSLFKNDFWIYKDNRIKEVKLEPLTDVYFSKISGAGIKQNSSTLISVLFAIVVLILILSIINYVNLTIAQSGMRAKEIAIRKLVGSSRFQLIIQYVVESVVLIFIAFSMAIFLAFLSENLFNQLLDTHIILVDATTTKIFLISILAILIIGIVSGIIPALIITKIQAIEVIKGGFRRKSKRFYSRLLIGFQYIVVIVLIISTIVISKQSLFLMNKDLGFSSKNIVLLPNLISSTQRESLKNEFLKVPGITNVSYVMGTPIDGGNNNSFTYNGKPVSFQIFKVDSAFFNMTDIKSQPTGVAYSKDGVWINRTAVKSLELDSLPKSFKIKEQEIQVLGVVDDFHFRSLYQKVGNLMIYQINEDDYSWSILVEIDAINTIETVKKLKDTYSEFTHGVPFDVRFFDDEIASWYEKEKRTSTIISYFAILSIIISVMGIFAMSIYYNQQKIKEIGIRKVNGATEFQIIQMLNKDFVKWVVIAFLIAVPIAWYAMNKWLQNFAYKTELSWWIFALAGVLALVIALLTVSWQSWKAATRNPVESLRYE